MKKYPIIDLHCDLLSFLADHETSWIEDPRPHCSYPQMKMGGVFLQTLAIFTYSNKNAHSYAKKQLQILKKILTDHSSEIKLWAPSATLSSERHLLVVPAFENAYSLCEENELISQGLSFLQNTLNDFGNVLYISLTWNEENRFGGGCGSKTGLKEDGKRLLEFLDQKKIAVDLSHASDPLAQDILNFLEKKSLSIPVIASHSNLRSITSQERNLPDTIAKEIIRRQGIIGLNFFAPFIGSSQEDLLRHVEHFFRLGGEKNICFGADFCHIESFGYLQTKYQTNVGFFPNLNNSSNYPFALSLLEKNLHLTDTQIESIAYKNFQSYVEKTFLKI